MPGTSIAMASLRARKVPTTALRSFRAARTAAFPATATVAAAARSYSTELEPEKPRSTEKHRGNEARLGRSFQGQVMGSIATRMNREREERERYEQWRLVKDPARNWSITFGRLLYSG